MREVTETYKVYNFNELSFAAKEKVRKWYVDGQYELGCIFEENCKIRLENLFPNSDLVMQYSLNYYQGDGVNIYGEIQLNELLEKIVENFTEKEMKFFKWAFNEYDTSFKMEYNRHGEYCICSRNNFMENIFYEMDNWYFRNIPEKTMKKFNKFAGEYLDNICKEFENDGYKFFYEISEEDLQKYCESNGYEFLKDGKIYVA